MQKAVSTFIFIGLLVLCGCPTRDRIFDEFGIFYGVAPGGYISAEYFVPADQKGEVDANAVFALAAAELLKVVRGEEPLRNGLSKDLAKVRYIGIDGFYVDKQQRWERFGAICFGIRDLAEVAQKGPTEDMSVRQQIGADERMSEFMRRYATKDRNAEPGATDNPGDAQ